jgi:hypothetical protein
MLPSELTVCGCSITSIRERVRCYWEQVLETSCRISTWHSNHYAIKPYRGGWQCWLVDQSSQFEFWQTSQPDKLLAVDKLRSGVQHSGRGLPTPTISRLSNTAPFSSKPCLSISLTNLIATTQSQPLRTIIVLEEIIQQLSQAWGNRGSLSLSPA